MLDNIIHNFYIYIIIYLYHMANFTIHMFGTFWCDISYYMLTTMAMSLLHMWYWHAVSLEKDFIDSFAIYIHDNIKYYVVNFSVVTKMRTHCLFYSIVAASTRSHNKPDKSKRKSKEKEKLPPALDKFLLSAASEKLSKPTILVHTALLFLADPCSIWAQVGGKRCWYSFW